MVYLANSSKQNIGGGWTFLDNLKKAIPEKITDYDQAEHYFIASASMVTRDEVLKAKDDGKKIILRVDNAIRNSRNRNTGMTRMFDFAQLADTVVYQSKWSREYLKPFLGVDGPVILNSADEKIFNEEGRNQAENTFLYSRYNRDETKNWEMARYSFARTFEFIPSSKLYIVGNFSQELRDGNFDFYAGENFEYLGVLDPHTMAKIYKLVQYFMYPYFNDACSNTLIEALLCGCKLFDVNNMTHTGGAQEIYETYLINPALLHLKRMGSQYSELL